MAEFKHMDQMQNLSKSELQDLIKEAVGNVLNERKAWLEDVVTEAILDMKFALAMEEGDTGEYVSESDMMSKLTSRQFL